MNELPVARVYFKRAASSYDRVRSRDKSTAVDDKAIETFLESIGSESRILDVPCGTGRSIPLIGNKNLIYTGVDISEDMLKICQVKALDLQGSKLIEADARALPFRNEEFDHLISFKFLKWLPSDEVVFQVLKEFRRVVKGTLLINVKVKPKKIRLDHKEILDRLRKLLDRYRLGTTARCIDQKVFEEMCIKVGFRIIKCEMNEASNGFVYNYTLECS
jgi:ubiquinone/menaquinone biosynthesis C-methylase UbiE